MHYRRAVPDSSAEPTETDRRALLAEIERDVRERRRSGAIDPAFEAELAGAFAAVAPAAGTAGGFDAVVDQAARHAIVDYDVPIHGRRPVRFVKRTVKQLTAWYLIFVGRQLVAFAATTLRALRILGRRVDALEQRNPLTDPRLVQADPDADGDLAAGWLDVIAPLVSARPAASVVAHADCGDGALVVALAATGATVYGVDPRREAGRRADDARIEVRCELALEHLRALAGDTIGVLVLSGCTDRLGTGDQIELVEQAARVLVPGGTVVVITTNPSAHSSADIVARDLAPGRPMHPDTWVHLLGRFEFERSTVHAAPCDLPADIRASDDPVVRAFAAAVFPPPSYAVVGHRAAR